MSRIDFTGRALDPFFRKAGSRRAGLQVSLAAAPWFLDPGDSLSSPWTTGSGGGFFMSVVFLFFILLVRFQHI